MALRLNLLIPVNVRRALYGLTFKTLAPCSQQIMIRRVNLSALKVAKEAHYMLAHISDAHL